MEYEIFKLTERLLANDFNNCAKYLTLDKQEICFGQKDVSKNPLFKNVNKAIFEVPTIKALLKLHDNYIPVSTCFISKN